MRRARAGRSSKKQPERRHADLRTAIDHPRRRRILRMLHDRGEPCNPIEIALKVEGPLGLIAYHVRVLRELGAVERVGEEGEQDSVEHFYESRIEGDPSIEAMLDEAEEEEEEEEEEDSEEDEEGEEKS
ncbi:MAG: winged helix-turn-helix domain-containing protein [Solirubrobacterales bacterium]